MRGIKTPHRVNVRSASSGMRSGIAPSGRRPERTTAAARRPADNTDAADLDQAPAIASGPRDQAAVPLLDAGAIVADKPGEQPAAAPQPNDLTRERATFPLPDSPRIRMPASPRTSAVAWMVVADHADLSRSVPADLAGQADDEAGAERRRRSSASGGPGRFSARIVPR